MTTEIQLRLLREAAAVDFGCAPTDVVRRVFEHWLRFFKRNPRRCKLGPARRTVIAAMLTVYEGDPEALELAIEGMAADPLEDCAPRMRDAMREIEWLLAKESRVERWAAKGDELRERLRGLFEQQAMEAVQAASAPKPVVQDEAAAKADREAQIRALIDMAQQLRGS